jgi:hypothetical protein
VKPGHRTRIPVLGRVPEHRIAPTRQAPGDRPVPAAPEPLGPAGFVLVTHRIGQRLHGGRRSDREAIQMQEDVELTEGQFAVLAQDA